MKRLTIFLITAGFIAGMPGCAPGPVQIRDWYDLHAIRNDVAGSYLLMNNLDSATAGYTELASATANEGKGWEPIGTPDQGFTGVFNGQGYAIRYLFINRPDQDFVGLFADISWIRYIDNVGVVENVGVVDARVTGFSLVGALAGYNEGIVNNSHSTGTVTGDSFVGGLVGWNQATLSNSYSDCSVTGDSRIGGLTGDNWYHRGIVSNCYSTGSVAGSTQVGGLVGYNTATVRNSFWDTLTSGQTNSAGGTGKTTAEMRNIATFSGAGWNIIAVANPDTRNPSYIWNIVNGVIYPFLSWQPVS